MPKKFLMCAAAAALALLCACSESGGFSDAETLSKKYVRSANASVTYNFSDGAEEPPASYNSYADLITNFELKLFRSAQSGNNENLLLSPACTALALAQLDSGAKNSAKSEIELVLGNGLNPDILNPCSSYFKSRLEGVGVTEENGETKSCVSLHSFLLVNDNTDVLTSFLQANADYYGSSVYRFSFENDDAGKKTEAALGEELSPEGELCAAYRCSITDSWLTPYAKEDAESGSFGGSDRLFLCSNEYYLHSDKAEGVIKYTEKSPLKMLFILPNEGTALDEYIKTFDYNEYMTLLDSFGITESRRAKIPVFSASSKTEKQNGLLQSCGLYTLFDKNADFSALAHSDASLGAVYSLKTSLRFSAQGVTTEESSADAAENAALSADSQAESGDGEICFDRPFMFMIIDNECSLPLMMGTVYK